MLRQWNNPIKMSDISLNIPDLEERFLPPENWTIKNFINKKTNHQIFYRKAFIEKAKGTIIYLPGLSEFGEKYIETARFFNAHNFNILVIDWAYQGLSSRYKENRHKRHSDSYDADISDLNKLIQLETDRSLPLYMIGHSMGGHIGLRYLTENPTIFQAASFSAPMIGIRIFRQTRYLAQKILKLFKKCHDCYVPNGKNWDANMRHDKNNIFSHDPIRSKIHNEWCIKNPDLQIGSPTIRWIYESLKSIQILQKKENLKKIKIPLLLFYADKEVLVDNKAIIKSAQHISQADSIRLESSKHEILMETDNIRNIFLEKTISLFNQ